MHRNIKVSDMPRILVIDDEPAVRKTIRIILERAGHEVVEAPNGRIAMEKLGSMTVDVVITDILMPDQEGIETIVALRRTGSPIKILAISGGGRSNNVDYLRMAEKLGADDTLGKPFQVQDLIAKVARLCPSAQPPGGGVEPA